MAERETVTSSELVVDDGLVGVTIDGKEVRVEKNTLVLDAATAAGVFIPVYCAHPKMDPVAVCRMCLVHVEKAPKLLPACATTVTDGMVVETKGDDVKKARAGVLEFLLLNHPLDCPVCDRGGECDLQDYAFRYGPQGSRFMTTQKAHLKKALPISEKIELDQERCVLCWRCVRFYDEITGEKEIVLGHRGIHTVVETLNGEPLTSAFQGNLPEVCPVGALTHRQYRFKARPWDLQRTPSICPGCAYGCNINVDSRNYDIERFVSRDNPLVEDMWLCDRGRYSAPDWNGMDRVRRAQLHVRAGDETPITAREAIAAAAEQLLHVKEKHGSSAIAVFGSPKATNEELWILQRISREILKTPHLNHTFADGMGYRPEEHALGIAALEECDAVIVVGDRAQQEAPVLTLRLHKAATKHQVKVLSVRATSDVAAAVTELHGAGTVGLVVDETDRPLAETCRTALMKANMHPLQLTITRAVNGRGAKDFGILPDAGPGYASISHKGNAAEKILAAAHSGSVKALVFLHGADLIEAEHQKALQTALSTAPVVIAIEAYPSIITEHATVLIPGHAFFEKSGTVTNTEGRVQKLRPALPPATAAPDELAVLIDLATALKEPLHLLPTAGAVWADLASAIPAYGASQMGSRIDWGED